ncbi:MAG: FG-GAP repeat protein, partial [Verrucomicrobiae bacterium]|nr:FG-GAP repeat protein [Verrucomicrobiae bacterium]
GRGLEQGWTFAHAPEPGAATIRMELAVRGGLRPEVAERAVAFRNEAGAAVLTYGGLKAWDADGNEVPVRFAEFNDEAFAVEADVRGARYPVTIDPIAQQAFLKASNTGSSDHFGYSVAVFGDTLVVGAPGEASPATGVNGDGSGNGLTESGAAYVFVRSGGVWVQQAYLKASNSGMLDGFGAAVAISGDTIVVGAPGEDSAATGVNGDELDNTAGSSGAVYVFVRSGNQWSQQAYLKASNTEDSDQFGLSVGISGETVVVGAEMEDGGAGGINGDDTDNNMSVAGAAYVFVRSRGKWSQQAYLKAAVPGIGDHFGHQVAISGESIIVGALNEDSDAIGIDGDGTNDDGPESGAAYVFVRSKGKWSQQAYLKASNADFYDEFGCSVAISGDTAVVGARGEDSSASRSISEGSSPANDFQNAGAAYVFFRTGTTWVEEAYLKPLKPEAGDFFGSAVAVSGDLVVVGAPLESSDATGVNGNDNNANAGSSGAAYAFSRMGWQWWQVAYLKASNTGASDVLGTAVALSGQTAIVGAYFEGSDAIGVNGNGNNNNAPGSGAAYVYTFGPDFRSLSHRQFRAPGEADLYYGIEGQAVIGDGAGVLFESGVTGVGATRGRSRATFSNFGASGEVDLLLQRYSLLSGVGSLPTGAKVTTMNSLVAHQWRRGLFLATVTGGGVNSTNNRVLFRDNGSFLVPLCRTGDEIAELGGAKPNVFKELGQHASDNALALSYTLARNTTLGVTLANDSGLLFLNHGGNVIGSMPREGDADGSGGVFGQFIGKAAIHDGPQAFFIAKSIPVTGAAIDRAYWTRHDTNSAPVPFLVAGGVAADGAALGATFRTLLATNGDAGAGTVRATLTGAPSTANEGIWVDSGPLLMLEGTEIYPMFQPGVAISRFVRYWAVGSDQILAQVILRGPGVKSTNNQALLLLENRRLLVLMRTGDRAPGFDKSTVTVGAISAVDLD